ncbi:MAG TPA: hypothetical protein VG994_13950 [Steroidobacteraceae bacterium]|nr:hypothetical protein [Steroidobacteraceae bacterium]
MTTATSAFSARHYDPLYQTDAVGPDSRQVAKATTALFRNASSVTVGHDKAALFQEVINARVTAETEDWDGEGAPALTQDAVDQAICLVYALPAHLPPPTIAPESTGEITFEWYRDPQNVAVLSVDGHAIRWASIHDGIAGTPGSAAFARTVPSSALLAVTKVLSRTR